MQTGTEASSKIQLITTTEFNPFKYLPSPLSDLNMLARNICRNPTIEDERSLDLHFGGGSVMCYAVFSEAHIVGVAWLTIVSFPNLSDVFIAHLSRFSVLPEHRHQEVGGQDLAERIARKLIELAESKKVSYIDFRPDPLIQLQYVERCGFSEVKEGVWRRILK